MTSEHFAPSGAKKDEKPFRTSGGVAAKRLIVLDSARDEPG
jgi:hypothetical protein